MEIEESILQNSVSHNISPEKITPNINEQELHQTQQQAEQTLEK